MTSVNVSGHILSGKSLSFYYDGWPMFTICGVWSYDSSSVHLTEISHLELK